MSDKKHITRNFDANQTNRIRYDSDEFHMEIKAFDHEHEWYWNYGLGSITTSKNAILGENTLTGYTSKDGKPFTISFKFKPTMEGTYRLELLYSNSFKKYGSTKLDLKDKPVSGGIESITYTNAKKKKKTLTCKSFGLGTYTGNDLTHNKAYTDLTIPSDAVNRTITIKLKMNTKSGNTYWHGLSVKKLRYYYADRHLGSKNELTIKKAKISHTNELDVDTLTVEIMYYHGLDAPLTEYGQSGYVFDYRDEINFFITDINGVDKQVFGGYISSVDVDADLTTMTISCASRLIDLENRYSLTETYINYVEPKDSVYNKKQNLILDVNNYKEISKYMCENSELPLKCNTGDLDKTNNNKKIKVTYGSKKKIKKLNYYKNSEVKFNKNNLYLRNRPEIGLFQEVLLLDSKQLSQDIILSTQSVSNKNKKGMNAMKITYGLGEKEYSVNTATTDGNSATNVGLASSVKKQAQKLMNAYGKEGWDMAKPIWEWMKAKIGYSFYTDFHRTPNSILSMSKPSANCCDHSRLYMNLLYACGVPINDMRYCNSSSVTFSSGNTYGHVWTELKMNGSWNNFYVDSSSKHTKWGHVNGRVNSAPKHYKFNGNTAPF